MSEIKDTKRLEKAQKLMIDWCEKTGKKINLTPDSALEVFECIADLTKQANEVEPSNYKALPIQSVSCRFSDADVRNIVLEMQNATMYAHSHKLSRFETRIELQKVKKKWKL